MTHQHPTILSRLSWVALLLGLLCTGLAAWEVKTTSEARAVKDFSFVTDHITTTVKERLTTYALMLRGGAGLFDASAEVTRQEWDQYVSKLQLSQAMSGISGVNFTLQISPAELEQHIAQVRTTGLADYHIWPSGPRDLYTSILFLSPFHARNQKALGYDMFTDPIRHQAMIQARDTGRVSLSGKVDLVIEDAEHRQAGTLMFAPVYQADRALESIAQRRAALIGWVHGAYRMDDFMEGILGDWQAQQQQPINLRIFDGTQVLDETLLYSSHAENRTASPSQFFQEHFLSFNGRPWLLTFDYIHPDQVINYTSTWLTLLMGLLLTSLLFFLMRTLANRRTRTWELAQQLTETVHQREQELKTVLHRLQTIASRVPGMVFEYRLYPDGRGCFPYASAGIKQIYSVTPEQVQEDAAFVFTTMHPDDLAEVERSVQLSADTMALWRHEFRIMLEDGTVRWVFGDSQPHRAEDGSISWYGMMTDITERKQVELALKVANQQTQRFRQALDHVPSCIFMKDTDLRYTYANRATLELLGCNAATLLGSDGIQLLGPTMSAQLRQADREALRGEQSQAEFTFTSPTGRAVNFLDIKTPIYDEADNRIIVGMLGIATDITALKANEQKLEHLAHYDPLTKLPNRLMLADRLHQAMLQADRHQQSLTIIYLDLDGFKQVNDRYGHTAGDHLLTTVAARMKAAIREGDTLARLGGDEFVAILLDIASLDVSMPLLERLLQAAARPVQLGHHRLQVSASLGVTFYPQPETQEPEQLIRQADQAMYQAKLAGKNRYFLFDTAQARYMREHHQSVEHIRVALDGDEFVLHYQPKVNMRTGDVIGVEALIRWQHPEQGLLAPANFLPIIEEHRLAIELGNWVIESALIQILDWQQSGLTLPVSVNIAARHLRQPDFATQLAKLLAKYPSVAPAMLELEVLETSTLGDLAQVSKTLEECRVLGVALSLDDFGTGYSSLTYLKRLPTNIIKVDQSFIRDILEDPEDLAILDGVLSLAKAFGRQVIAEGVETLAHGDSLLRMGCDLAQGYGIARPMPAADIPSWITHWQPAPQWAKIRRLNRNELPLLYAGLEHKAWIKELMLTLQNKHEHWPLFDVNSSHLTRWLTSTPNITPARLAYQHQLYQQTQQLVADIQQYKAGQNPRLTEQLIVLCELCDLLVNELVSCMNDQPI
ncbi:hypothetical protein CBP31_10505 [Oceanisphaera profunda]|uniref:Diguanylate cyclase n=1 Tax=Oceanisphaera profunda TaxID=1416627 RepID=A0A1Y0D622_9GAMM|nr:EAL domain-containing protein [Oceanisphaera profunda]ART83002.1 hypothetical protein CBP31_10505 [Oceanisphaera profunda]